MNLDTLAMMRANTSLTKVSSGTLVQSILRAINSKLAQNNAVLTTKLAQSFLSSASGDSLDLIGVLFNTPRGGNVLGARANIQKFYCTSGTLDTLLGIVNPIPAGTILQSADGIIQYRLAVDLPFNTGDTQVFGSIEAIVAGSSSNIGAGVLVSHGLDVPGLLTTNIESVDNGTDSQTDEEYRYILSKAVTAAEAANETSIRLAALSISGVADVRLVRYVHGIGTYGLIVIGTTPIVSTTVLQNTLSAITQVTAAGNFQTVRPPRYVGIEVGATLRFRSDTLDEDKDTIVEQVEDEIYDYINNIPMGEGFIRNELIQRIMDVSEKILDVDDEDTSLSKLSVHVWTPTTIDIEDGILVTNRIREPLTQNYTAYFDDKMVVECNMQGFTHETDFTPVIITYE